MMRKTDKKAPGWRITMPPDDKPKPTNTNPTGSAPVTMRRPAAVNRPTRTDSEDEDPKPVKARAAEIQRRDTVLQRLVQASNQRQTDRQRDARADPNRVPSPEDAAFEALEMIRENPAADPSRRLERLSARLPANARPAAEAALKASRNASAWASQNRDVLRSLPRDRTKELATGLTRDGVVRAEKAMPTPERERLTTRRIATSQGRAVQPLARVRGPSNEDD
jgi:hypothetical protein